MERTLENEQTIKKKYRERGTGFTARELLV